MPPIWLNPLAQKRKIESKGKGKESQEENKKNRIKRMEGFSLHFYATATASIRNITSIYTIFPLEDRKKKTCSQEFTMWLGR